MTAGTATVETVARHVPANGTDIHFIEAGQGDPLILLHGGVVTTNPIWAGVPLAYTSYLSTLAEHFRIIAPDTRGAGKTARSGGSTSFDQLADDVVALIDALGLDRPMVTGFSEGAITATILAIRSPDRSAPSSTTQATTSSIPSPPATPCSGRCWEAASTPRRQTRTRPRASSHNRTCCPCSRC